MKQEYAYKVYSIGPKDSTILNDKDRELVESYHLGIQSFNPEESRLDVIVSDNYSNVLETYTDSSDYVVRGVMQGSDKINQIEVDPTIYFEGRTFLDDQIVVEYQAFNNLYGKGAELYLVSVSTDRTEVQLKSITVSPRDIQYYTTLLQNNLNNQSYFSEAYLEIDEFGKIPIINALVEILDVGVVATFKLYEPLPVEVELKTLCKVLESLGESSRFLVKRETVVIEDPIPELKGPNFAVEVATSTVVTDYKSYLNLLSQKSWESSKGLYTAFKQSALHTSVDYTDFSDFIHFSSAAERLENARYKFELIFDLEAKQQKRIELGREADAQQIAKEIEGIIENFDHYENYLYFEESPYAWPKEVDPETGLTIRPHVLVKDPLKYDRWYENLFQLAEGYDLNNKDLLINTIPAMIREDLDHNEPYILFVEMIGQHFDDLWVYARAITDRYKGDNRPDFGISKELVKEALESFGIDLYESNQNLNGLFDLCQPDGTYDSGLENYVNKFRSARCPYTRSNSIDETGSFITGSWEQDEEFPTEDITYSLNPDVDQPMLAEAYTKEVYKRIYHNIPVLLKTRGTSRGLRVLLNCFGIPNDILKFRVQGGVSTLKRPFFGPEESIQISPEFVETASHCVVGVEAISGSFDKIRLVETPQVTEYRTEGSGTGSFFTSSVLSRYTPTTASHQPLTDDSHKVEVGFDLNEAVNQLFSQSLLESDFTVDDILGDPRNRLEHYGDPWKHLRARLVSQSLGEDEQYRTPAAIIRLVRYFDTTFFRMLQDFIPARASIDSGVIVRDNFLHRNRWKGVDVGFQVIIESGTITGSQVYASHGGSFRYSGEKADTGDQKWVINPDRGKIRKEIPSGSREINGELEGTEFQVTDGELTRDNGDRKSRQPENRYNINVWFLDLPDIPLCSSKLTSKFWTNYWELKVVGDLAQVSGSWPGKSINLVRGETYEIFSTSSFYVDVQTHWTEVNGWPKANAVFMGWFSGSFNPGYPVTAHHHVDLSDFTEGEDYKWIAAYKTSPKSNKLWFTTVRPGVDVTGSVGYYFKDDLMVSWKYLPAGDDPRHVTMSTAEWDSGSVWNLIGVPTIILEKESSSLEPVRITMPAKEIFGIHEGYFWVGFSSMSRDKFTGVERIGDRNSSQGKTGPFIQNDGTIVDAQWESARGDWPDVTWDIKIGNGGVSEDIEPKIPQPNDMWIQVN